MDRRDFVTTSAALIALSGLSGYAEQLADTRKRVGLIGTGWYGKADLLRLIQVAPVEVVSLCDVDRRMLADAAALVASRQASSKKTPRTYTDYRAMLRERDLDIVLIGTPDHWHALPMIDAVKSGADVWVQKPISVDIVEGQAMLAAARKYKRVVQVGMQRRSTPHLYHGARPRHPGRDSSARSASSRSTATTTCARPANPPDTAPPANLDYEMWTGPAPMRPTTRSCTRAAGARSWNTATASSATCASTCSTWCAGCWTSACRRASARPAASWWTRRARRTSPTRRRPRSTSASLPVVWTHRTYGDAPDPKYPWGATFYGDKGTLKGERDGLRLRALRRQGPAIHEDVVYELDQFPEDRTEKDLERHVAPAIRAHMKNFLECIASRGTPVADIEQGYMSATACILANHSMRLGRSLQWDHAKGMVVGDPEANQLLRRPYRAPWVHPDPATV